MDSIISHLEENLEFKFNMGEIAVFRKEFENYYLVPLLTLEQKMNDALEMPFEVEISLLKFTFKILEEWERYQNK